MDKFLYFFQQNISYFILAFLGLIILYIKSFIQESAKVSALKRKNKELIEETERIKKDHQLDISKRKYQYESKRQTYFHFFQLLDQFTKENNVKNQEKLIEILDEFNRNYLNAASQNNRKNESQAVTVMSKRIQKLTFDASQDLIRIKQETNTIRLIASDTILRKLDLLNFAYDKSMEVSNKMMSSLPALMLNNNQEQMKADQQEIEISAKVINSIKDEIIELMRLELNEI